MVAVLTLMCVLLPPSHRGSAIPVDGPLARDWRPVLAALEDLLGPPKGISGARIASCLVQRSNRDGHCMRTFEVPGYRRLHVD